MTEKEKEKKESFFVIPESILFDPALSPLDKMLWAYLNGLSFKEPCYAKNNHFMEKFNIEKSTLVRSLNSLKNKNLIVIQDPLGKKRKITTVSNLTRLGCHKRTGSPSDPSILIPNSNNPPNLPKGKGLKTEEIEELQKKYDCLDITKTIEHFIELNPKASRRQLLKALNTHAGNHNYPRKGETKPWLEITGKEVTIKF